MVTNDRRIVDAAYIVRRAWAASKRQRNGAPPRRRPPTTWCRTPSWPNMPRSVPHARIAAGIGRSAADGLTVQQMTDCAACPPPAYGGSPPAVGSDQHRQQATASHP